jgi:hypothetical protein
MRNAIGSIELDNEAKDRGERGGQQREASMRMELAEWQAKYGKMQAIADRIRWYRNDRARKACEEAGLDPTLLGIHPHNAMCAYRSGKPWKGIDYSKVRLCLRELSREFEGYDILRKWDARVR